MTSNIGVASLYWTLSDTTKLTAALWVRRLPGPHGTDTVPIHASGCQGRIRTYATRAYEAGKHSVALLGDICCVMKVLPRTRGPYLFIYRTKYISVRLVNSVELGLWPSVRILELKRGLEPRTY